MSDTDVIVVGAGAAGLAAGRRLAELGLSAVVIEAKERVGGRAWTDNDVFGVPFDRGCHWLHSASINPLVPIADALGIRYLVRTIRRSHTLFLNDAIADEATKEESWAAVRSAFEFGHGEEAGDATPDVALSEVLDLGGRWSRLMRHWVGLLSSFEPEEVSTLDLVRYRDTGENWPVADGYGTLILRHGAVVPVRLGVRAQVVRRIPGGVEVETDAGTLRARAAIVTVSTNVLASGRIGFEPGLPDETAAAIEACPVGHAEKIAFRLSRPIEGFGPTTYVEMLDPDDALRRPINFTLNHFGEPIIVGQLGGNLARDLEAAGEATAADFALAALVEAFGSEIRRQVVATTMTHWASDPDILGAYSCARPGEADRRRQLREPIEDVIFLAGEAVSWDFYSTAHGAHLTGIDAAERIHARLTDAVGN